MSGAGDEIRAMRAAGMFASDRNVTPPRVTDADAILSGDEGEVVFIRHAIASTETAARAYALEHDGRNLIGYEADVVEMLPVPDHFLVEESWWCAQPGTPGAVRYWRFRL